MTKRPLILAGAVLLCLFGFTVGAVQAQDPTKEELEKAFQDAIALFKRSESTPLSNDRLKLLSSSEAKFRLVDKHVPGNAHVRRHLVLIKNARKDIQRIPLMKRQLETIRLEKLNVEEISLADVLEYIGNQTKKLSSGRIEPNFMFRPANSEMSDRLVTLNLRKVPVSFLLESIGKSAGVKFTYDKFAILVTSTRIVPSDNGS